MKRTFFVSYITHQLASEGSIVNTTVTLVEEQKANVEGSTNRKNQITNCVEANYQYFPSQML